MEEQSKNESNISVSMTLVIGLLFTIAFIVLMAIFSNQSQLLHNQASEGYKLCSTGECNFQVTETLRKNIAELGARSYIVFGAMLLVGSGLVFVPSFGFKDLKKEARVVAFTFVKIYLAFMIADLMIFTVGQMMSISESLSDSVLEYFLYTLDGFAALTIIFLAIDLVLVIAKKRSFVFFKATDSIAIIEGFGILVSLIPIILLVASYSPSGLIAFALVHFIIVPVVVFIECAILTIKFTSWITRNVIKKKAKKDIISEDY